MNTYKKIVLSVVGLLTLLAFQNCAPMKENKGAASLSSTGTNNNNSNGNNNTPSPAPAPIPCLNVFCASFFNDIDRLEFAFNIEQSAPFYSDWGGESPDPSVEPDTFSAQYVGNFDFEDGDYEFTVIADDGIQLFVDGSIVLDYYFDQAPATYTVTMPMTAGNHSVEILYYENGGGAVLGAGWTKL